MTKKSQISLTFVYIIAALVIVMIIIFGFKAIQNMQGKKELMELTLAKTKLTNDIDLISMKYGTVEIQKYTFPSKYSELCFTNTKDKNDLPPAFVDKHPLIADSVETGDNALLIGKKFETFKVDNLHIPDNIICFPIIKGAIKFKMLGRGNSTIISAVETVTAVVNVPEGLSTENINMISQDYSAVLEIPTEVNVDYPEEVEEQISVIEVTSPLPITSTIEMVGKVYDFQPDGLTFSEAVPITLSYNPDEVSDPSVLKIYYYDGNEWLSLDGDFEIDETAHTITGYTTHFTYYGVGFDSEGILTQKPVTYLSDQISKNHIADPFILNDGGKYYLYFTGDNHNVPIYESLDFINWNLVGHTFQNNKIDVPDKKKWERGHEHENANYKYLYVWAPEVIKINSDYYGQAFTAMQISKSETNEDYWHLLNSGNIYTVWMAFSDNPKGPFGPRNNQFMHEPIPFRNRLSYTEPNFITTQPHSELKPGCPSETNPKGGPCITPIRLDGHFFKDGNDLWLAYSWEGQKASEYPSTTDQGQHLAMVKLDPGDLTLTHQTSPESIRLTNSRDILYDSKTGQKMHMCVFGADRTVGNSDLLYGKKQCINEAPFIIKHNSKYYLFYSANVFDSNTYSIYYKMANSLRCLEHGLESDSNCEVKQGIAFDGIHGDSDYTYGHGTIVKGPNGKLFHVITVMKKNEVKRNNHNAYRKIWVVEQEFNNDNTPKTVSPDINDMVSIDEEIISETYDCGGTAPSDAGITKGPETYSAGYSQTSWTYSTTASHSTPCKWKCGSGYSRSGNTCVSADPETYNCGGTIPSGTGIIKGPETYSAGYSPASWTYSIIASHSTPCKWKCDVGYLRSGNTCVSATPQTYNCGGTIPSGTGVTKGPETYSAGYSPASWTYSTTASDSTPCKWKCSSGYLKSGNTCVSSIPQTYNCEGTIPSGTGVTKGPETYSAGYSPASWTYSTTASDSTPCKWKCDSGYLRSGNTCVLDVTFYEFTVDVAETNLGSSVCTGNSKCPWASSVSSPSDDWFTSNSPIHRFCDSYNDNVWLRFCACYQGSGCQCASWFSESCGQGNNDICAITIDVSSPQNGGTPGSCTAPFSCPYVDSWYKYNPQDFPINLNNPSAQDFYVRACRSYDCQAGIFSCDDWYKISLTNAGAPVIV